MHLLRRLAAAFLLAAAAAAALASSAAPASAAPPPSEWGTNRYVEYRPGTGALVLSAPHGGDVEPASIPDRTGGTTVTDSNTIDVATLVQDGFPEAQRPHLVICHLARTKLDANREIVEAAEGNPEAELAWEEYHGFIERARAAVAATYGRGLYVDLHGQSHPENWTECGLLLTSSELNRYTDDDLNDPAIYNLTSLRNLCAVSQVCRPPPVPHARTAGSAFLHAHCCVLRVFFARTGRDARNDSARRDERVRAAGKLWLPGRPVADQPGPGHRQLL